MSQPNDIMLLRQKQQQMVALANLVKEQRQKTYQESMEKLKDLNLRSLNTLGFMKSSMRQTAVVASMVIMKHKLAQQSQGAVSATSSLSPVVNNNSVLSEQLVK